MTHSNSLNIRSYRPLIGPIFLPTVCFALALGIAVPIMPLYVQDLGASYAVIGSVVSARSLGSFLNSLPGGAVLAKLSMRTTMILGSAMVIAALLAIFMIANIWAVFLGWLFVGIGFSFFELARHQFIAFHINNQFRGRAVSILGGTNRLGSVIGPILGGSIAQRYSFQAPFLLMAAAVLVAIVIIVAYVPHTLSEPVSKNQQEDGYWLTLWQTVKQHWHIIGVAGGGQLLMQTLRRARGILIPLIAANAIGLDVATIGVVISIGSAFDTLMFPLAGYIMDNYGRKKAIIPSILLQASGFFLMPVATGFGTLVIVASLIGFGNGISSGTMLTLGADLAPDDQRVPFLGIWRLTSSMGFVVGPNAVGLVAQLFALNPASIVIGGIGLCAAGVFWRFVPETLDNG